MKQKQIISYIYDFLSLLFEKEDIKNINNIILFGSIARNEFDTESDIDIFIDTEKNQKEIEKKINSALNSFHTRIEKIWKLKGIDLSLKPLVGNLKESKWKELKKEISHGILLYGEYKEFPKKIEHYHLFTYSIKNLKRKDKMKFLRKLYGYKSKKEKKIYHQKGLLEQIGGKRLGTHSIITSQKNIKEIKNLLEAFKINYTIKEIWL